MQHNLLLCFYVSCVISIGFILCAPVLESVQLLRNDTGNTDGQLESVQLLRYDAKNTENEKDFSYELSDGQSRVENVFVKNLGTDKEELVISGWYAFEDNQKIYNITYFADHTGYHANLTISDLFVSFISPTVIKSMVG